MMAKTLKSTLSGVWLMQTVKMSVPVPCTIEYTVRHRGDGNNKLRVRFGNFWHFVWAQVHDFHIEALKSKSRTSEFGGEDENQDVRWRLSRGALTKAIDWELTYTSPVSRAGPMRRASATRPSPTMTDRPIAAGPCGAVCGG
jgi:hypothetical protein